jgi:hypothetical protein
VSAQSGLDTIFRQSDFLGLHTAFSVLLCSCPLNATAAAAHTRARTHACTDALICAQKQDCNCASTAASNKASESIGEAGQALKSGSKKCCSAPSCDCHPGSTSAGAGAGAGLTKSSSRSTGL